MNEDILTPRELQVLRLLIIEALTNPEIADRLRLSEETVKTYVTRIMVKLDARNRVDSAVKAIQLGLVELDELEEPGPRGLYRLTGREEDVLVLLKQGLQAWEVGEQLGIDKGSVYNLEQRIRRKWNVTSRKEILARARTYRLRRRKPPAAG